MTELPQTPAALEGVRVLDLSRVLAGPWASQNLGDLGADIVKVESLDGDDTRLWGPPFCEPEGGRPADAAYYTACNRNKRSVCIDFSRPEGAALVRELAAGADIVIENFKVGGLAKYGLDYASLRKVNPGIVYCSVTGFGQTGPYASRAGYDFLIQGIAGLMSITGLPDGAPGGGPVKVGVAVCDLFTGMYATVAILAALRHRERTGEGQHIDCSLFDTQVAMLANQASNWLVGGMNPGRMGNSHPNLVPYATYPVSDGHVIIAVGNDRQFGKLCAVLGAPELATDPRFAVPSARVANRDALEEALRARLGGFTRARIIAALEAAGVPCGPINGVSEVFAEPHAMARGVEVALERPEGHEIRTVAFPAKLSATPATYRIAPPVLGADTRAVLSGLLGRPEAEIERLVAEGVVA